MIYVTFVVVKENIIIIMMKMVMGLYVEQLRKNFVLMTQHYLQNVLQILVIRVGILQLIMK